MHAWNYTTRFTGTCFPLQCTQLSLILSPCSTQLSLHPFPHFFFTPPISVLAEHNKHVAVYMELRCATQVDTDNAWLSEDTAASYSSLIILKASITSVRKIVSQHTNHNSTPSQASQWAQFTTDSAANEQGGWGGGGRWGDREEGWPLWPISAPDKHVETPPPPPPHTHKLSRFHQHKPHATSSLIPPPLPPHGHPGLLPPAAHPARQDAHSQAQNSLANPLTGQAFASLACKNCLLITINSQTPKKCSSAVPKGTAVWHQQLKTARTSCLVTGLNQ